MSRRKKPQGETPDQTQCRHALETISGQATRSEKVSWDRKMDNMIRHLATLRPIEEQITDLMETKQPILDQIAALRAEMVRECIHPFQLLVLAGDHVKCKFCEHKFSVASNA